MSKLDPKLKPLAITARLKSYSPYSTRQVGAAIKLSNGKIYSGCNVENSSFGGTVCAERVAVWKAVSEEGPGIEITEVSIATDASPPWSPCGMCRQVINEFASKSCVVELVNLGTDVITYNFSDLLPHGFDRSSLLK